MKVTKRENFRVILEISERQYDYLKDQPDRYERALIGECDGVMDQIKRHVDYLGTIRSDWDVREVCSHCGYTWETDESGEPVCCNAAVDEFNTLKTEPIL